MEAESSKPHLPTFKDGSSSSNVLLRKISNIQRSWLEKTLVRWQFDSSIMILHRRLLSGTSVHLSADLTNASVSTHLIFKAFPVSSSTSGFFQIVLFKV